VDAAAEQDLDLAWQVAIRRASLGRYDADAVEALLERDPDPDAPTRALAVAAARPTAEAKDEAWERVFVDRAVPAGPPLSEVAQAFWRPVQHDLLVPYADRYLDTVADLRSEGMMTTLSLVGAMHPTTCADDWPDRAIALAEREGTDPIVRTRLLTEADTMARVLRARG
jgi:aminopeptidase N